MFGASRWLELTASEAASAAAAVTAAITASFLIDRDGFLMFLPLGSDALGSAGAGPSLGLAWLSALTTPLTDGTGTRINRQPPHYRSIDVFGTIPAMAIRAVISDFGGVLTTPLLGSFLAFQDETGISAEALGRAMQRIAEREGEHPLFELERGRLAESEFLDLLRAELDARAGPRAASCTASARSTSRRSTPTSR